MTFLEFLSGMNPDKVPQAWGSVENLVRALEAATQANRSAIGAGPVRLPPLDLSFLAQMDPDAMKPAGPNRFVPPGGQGWKGR